MSPPTPPSGVPRWLFPPRGAVVRRVVLRESATADGPLHEVVEGTPPEASHLRALQWLVGEHPREETPAARGAPAQVVLEIARTEMSPGRVGHAYALDGGALGAPGNRAARGVLWRYAHAILRTAPEAFDHDDDWADPGTKPGPSGSDDPAGP